MLKEIPFGEFTPDLAPSHSNHLSLAKNVRPIANGYAPVKDVVAFTDSLVTTFGGGGSFIASDGTSVLLVGTASAGGIYNWDGAWTLEWVLPAGALDRVRFTQFGDNICIAAGFTVSRLNILTMTGSTIATSPTGVIDVATIGDFVFALKDNNEVQWSEFNNSGSWTVGTNQADYQPLLDGGQGVAIVGGEYGIVLQKSAIRRITYTGQEGVWFQFDVISPEIGCMSQGSVANVGRLIFFLSERGFEMCDGQTVTPIGDEKINRWFFDTYSRSDIESMYAAVDPRNSVVVWSIPGNPGALVKYNWVLQRWAVEEVDVAGVFSGFTTAMALEDVDTLFPTGLDDVPVSLDDPSLSGGSPVLLIALPDDSVGAQTGATLAATLEQKNIELAPGKRARLRGLRPVTDAVSAEATVNAKMRAGDGEAQEVASTMRSNGKMPIRANGRYYDLALTIPAGESWSYVQSCEFEFEPGDGR